MDADDPGREEDDTPREDAVYPVPIEDVLDLHAFRPADVRDLLQEYLGECRRMRFRQVRIIHGRGIGVLRETVRAALARHPAVLSFRDAEAELGGWGATVVFLKAEEGEPGEERAAG